MAKVYIAGPMTGLPELNYPAFAARAAELRAAGHEVVSPAELNPSHDTPYAVAMRNDIRALLECDVIHLLEGWEKSKGAKCEKHIADVLNMPVLIDGIEGFAVYGP